MATTRSMSERDPSDQMRVSSIDGGVRLTLRVAPRASKAALGGVHDGALKVRVTAPPVDGAANAAVVSLLSKALGVPKRAISIVAGESSRTKTVEIRGVDEAAIRALTS